VPVSCAFVALELYDAAAGRAGGRCWTFWWKRVGQDGTTLLRALQRQVEAIR
jgi:hypothetical protein